MKICKSCSYVSRCCQSVCPRCGSPLVETKSSGVKSPPEPKKEGEKK